GDEEERVGTLRDRRVGRFRGEKGGRGQGASGGGVAAVATAVDGIIRQLQEQESVAGAVRALGRPPCTAQPAHAVPSHGVWRGGGGRGGGCGCGGPWGRPRGRGWGGGGGGGRTPGAGSWRALCCPGRRTPSRLWPPPPPAPPGRPGS